MIPPALFRSRPFAAANAVSFFMYGGLFGVLFLMSQLFQTALGYSSIETGLRLLPWTLTPMFIAPVAGVLADRYGSRPFMVLGLVLQAVGYAWIAAIVSTSPDYLEFGAAFTVTGMGTSFCFPTVANAIMGSVPLRHAGVASGVNSALRELGGVVGVSVLAAVFAARGGYGSAHEFVDGFTPATLGRGRAVGRGRRRRVDDRCAAPERRPAGRGGPRRGVVPSPPPFTECSLEIRTVIR